MKKQSGFTLVEIAIVLVIIGLLLGGVLKGQEIIAQAKIKNVINDINGVTAAVQAYQDRYKALPGDDPNAVTRWGASTVVATNPGTGTLTGNYNVATTAAPTAAQESNLFWQHLRLANFVAGASTGPSSGSPPTNAAGGIIGVQTGGMGFTSNVICLSNLPDKIAIAVDSAIDDGNALTGQVRAKLQTAPNPDVAADAPVAADAYAETGNNQYVVCKNL
jgi:prepilin-type N-terminal cleavage/methylation domain-containing protein